MKHLSRGNRTYISIHGYLVETKAAWDEIGACTGCYKVHLDHPSNLTKRNCISLVCWNMIDDLNQYFKLDDTTYFPLKWE